MIKVKLRKRLTNFHHKFYHSKIKEVVIDHEKFLGKKCNSYKIYKGNANQFIISPFNMTFDEMDRLLVVDFEDDELYHSMELQIFQIKQNEFPLVILYRRDNLIDLYFTEPRVLENREELLKSLRGDISFNISDNLNVRFTYDKFGLDCSISFIDKFERKIQFKLRENYANRKLSSMLAPIGAKSKQPQYFPIIYLNQFGMVILKGSSISITIDGEEKKPSQIPFKMSDEDYYLTRFSLNPIICNWNKTYNGDITLLRVETNSKDLFHQNISYSLVDYNGFLEIKKFESIDRKNNKVWFEFSPAIPNLMALGKNIRVKGKFSCGINEKKGIFGGEYNINTIDNTIKIQILPTKGWQAYPGKKWFRTYKWIAILTLQENKVFQINSSWRRV